MHTTLRAETGTDRDFLRGLFGQLRGREAGMAALDPVVLAQLLDLQFAAQQQAFRQGYPGARFELVEADGVPLGRLVVAPADGALLLVDIALLPAVCGRGIGSALLRALQQEAAQAGLPLRLQVVLNNPAEALYRRLGFKDTGMSGMHRTMEWEKDND